MIFIEIMGGGNTNTPLDLSGVTFYLLNAGPCIRISDSEFYPPIITINSCNTASAFIEGRSD